jgi:hypothetical protein
MSGTRTALEYLVACSEMSLEAFQISRMNQAANLRRQVRLLVDQWIEAEMDAGISRWMLERQRGRMPLSRSRMDSPSSDKFLERVAIVPLLCRVEVLAVTPLQERLSIATADAGPVREYLSLEDGAEATDNRKNVPEERPPREKKPYAKPFAQKHAVVFLPAGRALAVAAYSRLRTQRELQFEFGESISGS